MMQTKTFVMLAGAALSLGAVNAAQAVQSNDDVRAVVAQMMSDAETRSSLLSGGDAGHDGKFFIAGDGFRLNVGGQIQFRYVLNFRDDNITPDDDFSNGFQTRRTKLDFNGNINNNWDYRVLFSFHRDNGSAVLEEAWGQYRFENGVHFKWGQFKLPLLREEIVSSSKQLAVERSQTNEAFTQDRSQGIQLSASYDQWRWFLAFSDGLDSENTDFNGPGGALVGGFPPFRTVGEAEYAFTGRVDFLCSGSDWKVFDDFTSAKGQEFTCLLGVAGHWQQSTQTPNPADADFDTFQATVDASLEGDSWNLYGAFIYRFQDFENAGVGGNNDASDYGAIVQGGWRFAENTEVFARWDGIFADEDRFGSGEDNFQFVTFGFNQYYAGHAAKASVDCVVSLNDTSNLYNTGALSDTGTGILGDTEEGEVAVRFQMQLLF